MRIGLSLYLMVIAFALNAQNWALYPYMQKTYYSDGYIQCHDSVYVSGGDSIFAFDLKAPVAEWQQCYDSLNVYYPIFVNSKNYFIRSGDIYFLSNDNFYYDPLLFDMSVKNPGDFWEIPVDNISSPWDHVVATLDSVALLEVFGQMDSVRYYSFDVSPLAIGEFAIDDFVVRVSKSFGLLDNFSFSGVANGSDCGTCFKTNPVVGVATLTDTLGPIQAKWSDYIRLQPGDKLKFKSYSDYMGTSSYWVHTISAVEKYSDSVLIYYEGGGVNRIYREAVQYILEGSNNQVNYGVGGAGIASFYNYEDTKTVASHISSYYIYEGVPGEQSITKEFASNWRISPDLCTVDYYWEGGIFSEYNTYMGLIGGSNCSADSGCDGYYLVGSVLSGYAYGNYWPVTIDEISQGGELVIFPNPTHQYIQIDYMTDDLRFCVRSLSGGIIMQGVVLDGKIDVSGLSNGMYVLQLQDDGIIRAGKFLKN